MKSDEVAMEGKKKIRIDFWNAVWSFWDLCSAGLPHF